MVLKVNPFRPGSIVTPGMFSGRMAELEALERCLAQTRAGNPTHFMIHGERGIGKSSLMLVLNYVAQGDLPPVDEEMGRFTFRVIRIDLDAGCGRGDILAAVSRKLANAIPDGKVTGLAKRFWDIAKKFEVMGVSYKDDPGVGRQILEELTEAAAVVENPDCGDGLLLLIDEADKPRPSAGLGEFAKLYTEGLTALGCHRVCLGLAGLPGIRSRLRASHESALRLFQTLPLKPLSSEESDRVVRLGLDVVNQANGSPVTVTENALAMVHAFAQGYPHFIQQFAYSAFDEDTDGNIDQNDVFSGAVGENGAFKKLGEAWFQEQFFEKLYSDDYRAVLRAMSESHDEWVTKAQIRERTDIKETVLNSALKALKEREIIKTKVGKKGVYKLPTRAFAVWIQAFTEVKR